MPIVADATVRLRLVGVGVQRQIREAVRRGVAGAEGDVDRQGLGVGERFGEAFGDGIRRAAPRMRRAGQRSVRDMGRDMEREMARSVRPRMRNAFGEMGINSVDSFVDSFNFGIGASHMGKSMVSLLTLAGPSLLSGAAAIGTAMATELVTAFSAVGPGLVGAGGVGLAALSSMALSAGLLSLAFKADVEGLKDIAEAWGALGKEIGRPIAEGMLSGMRDAVATLRQALPQLNGVLRRTGEEFGAVAKRIAETVTSAANMSRIDRILGTNATFIAALGRGLSGLTTSFLILFAAAKPFVDFVGEGIARFGEWAQATLEAKEANGELAAWMDRMLAKFQQLWAIVKDFGAGIWNVFQAASPVGEKLLETVAGIGERFRAWTENPENMARMTGFFEKAHTLASKVFEILGAIFTAAGRAFEGMDLGPLLRVLDSLQTKVVPAIARIFKQIQTGAGDKLVQIVDNIGGALTRIADSGVIEKAAGLLASLVLVFTELVDTPVGAAIAGAGLAFLLFGGIIRTIAGAAVSLLGAVSLPVLAIIAAFVFLYTQSQKLRDAIAELWEKMKPVATEVYERMEPSIRRLLEAVLPLAAAIGDLLVPVFKLLGIILPPIFFLVGGAITFIIETLTLLAQFATGWLSGDWQPFVDNVIRIAELLRGWWQEFALWFSTKLGEISDTAVRVLGALPGLLFNVTIQPIEDEWNRLWNRVETIGSAAWTVISEFFSRAWATFTGAFWLGLNIIVAYWSGIWNSVLNEGARIWSIILTGWRVVASAVELVLGVLGGAIRAIWNGIVGTTLSILGGLAGGIRSALSDVSSAIVAPFLAAYGIVSGIVSGIRSLIASISGKIGGTAVIAPAGGGMLDALTAGIPALAHGGIVPAGAGLYWLGDGGRRERVEPLGPNGWSPRDEMMVASIVRQLMGGSRGGGDVNVYLGGERIAQFVENVIDTRESKLARRVQHARRG